MNSLGFAKQVALAPFTSWQVGGPAEFYARPTTIDELKTNLREAQRQGLAVTFLSGGTNVLISDRGVKGLLVHLAQLSGVQVEERGGRLHMTAMAGTSKSELLKIFLRYQLAPAQFLAGIPGDVGGGVVMNAGVAEALAPREFCEIVDWLEVLRLVEGEWQTARLAADKLQWSYRHCSGWQPGVITRVGISWPLQADSEVLGRVRALNQTRLQKQPLELPSCGSVFVNPDGFKAGQLIDSSELKGFRIGDAQVSIKHANFIVNRGHATASEIRAIIEHVQNTVRVRHGQELTTEVVMMGEW